MRDFLGFELSKQLENQWQPFVFNIIVFQINDLNNIYLQFQSDRFLLWIFFLQYDFRIWLYHGNRIYENT